jgi:hypothetical protein
MMDIAGWQEHGDKVWRSLDETDNNNQNSSLPWCIPVIYMDSPFAWCNDTASLATGCLFFIDTLSAHWLLSVHTRY